MTCSAPMFCFAVSTGPPYLGTESLLGLYDPSMTFICEFQHLLTQFPWNDYLVPLNTNFPSTVNSFLTALKAGSPTVQSLV